MIGYTWLENYKITKVSSNMCHISYQLFIVFYMINLYLKFLSSLGRIYSSILIVE